MNTPEPGRRRRRRALKYILLIGLALSAASLLIIPRLNRYQTDGQLVIAGIAKPIKIVRDEKGMPYIHASNERDLLFGQGFATAQDRLFQLQLMLLQAQGRLCELAGQAARDTDVRMRTIGIHRLAKQHATILDDRSRQAFQAYVDGINAFLDCCPGDVPLEFKIAGIQPQRWTIEDSLSILYLMSWDTSANVKHEVIAQMLVDKLGEQAANELLPINWNPDNGAKPITSVQAAPLVKPLSSLFPALNLAQDPNIGGLLESGSLQIGSNNWVTGPSLSANGQAMLVGDPHLDPRMLPGIMYAVGLILPDTRAVGVNVPGLPGFMIGRTTHIATAATNNYGDVQDLYVETIDPNNPDHYLEGGKSLPFQVITETLLIKDKSAEDGFREESIEIRMTSRGPVVTDVIGIETDKVLSLRWAAAESMKPQLGLTDLLTAKTVDQVDAALKSLTTIVLNIVFADSSGNIAWRVSGTLPKRTSGGTLPVPIPIDAPWQDNWQGWIEFDDMPYQRNPDAGWLGTANHYTTNSQFPHYYSNFAAPSYRYRRLQQRIAQQTDAGQKLTTEEHWSIQRDTLNLMAESVTPKLITALAGEPSTAQLADVLKDWNYQDDIDSAGTTVFQTLYCQLAKATFSDELGEELAVKMLSNWYFWQERFEAMLLQGDSHWFDDVTTPDTTETLDDMIVRAGQAALATMTPILGADPGQWRWGDVHTLTFVNPLRRSGLGSGLLGSGALPANGSGETLHRGWYAFEDPYHVISTAATRMVVDFADNEKVQAVVAGGTTARTFHPHQQNQVDAFMTGQPLYWWFSEAALQEHATTQLELVPDP